MVINIIVKGGLVSEQIKKFWDLETSGLFDETESSDIFENEVRKKFESETEYQNKQCVVKLPWKLCKEQLNNNRKIAGSRFLKLKKKFCRNRELYSEYRNVLQNY